MGALVTTLSENFADDAPSSVARPPAWRHAISTGIRHQSSCQQGGGVRRRRRRRQRERCRGLCHLCPPSLERRTWCLRKVRRMRREEEEDRISHRQVRRSDRLSASVSAAVCARSPPAHTTRCNCRGKLQSRHYRLARSTSGSRGKIRFARARAAAPGQFVRSERCCAASSGSARRFLA